MPDNIAPICGAFGKAVFLQKANIREVEREEVLEMIGMSTMKECSLLEQMHMDIMIGLLQRKERKATFLQSMKVNNPSTFCSPVFH